MPEPEMVKRLLDSLTEEDIARIKKEIKKEDALARDAAIEMGINPDLKDVGCK